MSRKIGQQHFITLSIYVERPSESVCSITNSFAKLLLKLDCDDIIIKYIDVFFCGNPAINYRVAVIIKNKAPSS